MRRRSSASSDPRLRRSLAPAVLSAPAAVWLRVKPATEARQLHLYEVVGFPGRIAIGRVQLPIEDGVFFLDFTRPLLTLGRWLVHAYEVPVIHAAETAGSRALRISRGHEILEDLRDLWAAYYPGQAYPVSLQRTAARIETEFRAHFHVAK